MTESTKPKVTKAAMKSKIPKAEPIKDKDELKDKEPPNEPKSPPPIEPESPKTAPTSPKNPEQTTGTTPKETPTIATIDRMRAREDIPVELDPRTIGKIRSPNFAQFKTSSSAGLGPLSAKKLRKDLEMSGTPTHTPTKNRYAPAVDKADFELDICAKIGAIKWDSDDD
ncbi:hypothetical protein TWF481_002329 [Arthrobotrys musiformis]|uniref:Uncharacterized protein n=1 Tax=Arthrobotrys musiformis TaxID=47236 RepID=A0AAV9VUZ2_9PEZI